MMINTITPRKDMIHRACVVQKQKKISTNELKISKTYFACQLITWLEKNKKVRGRERERGKREKERERDKGLKK